MVYRSTFQIYADILTVADQSDRFGVQTTKLCLESNLPYSRFRGFVRNLTSSGLINKIEYDGKNTFVITANGKKYLEEYKKFSDYAESFGLELRIFL